MDNDGMRNRRDRGAVATAEEMRDDDRTVVEERPVAPRTYTEPPPRRRNTGAGMGLGIFLALAALLIIGLLIWALMAGDENADEVLPGGVTVDDITDNPARYLGQTVTTAGEVDEILGPRAFTIGGDDFIGEDELLVVGANQLPAIQGRPGAEQLAENDVVTVRGTVRRFVLADVERDLGVDLEDNLFRDWADKPAIVAQQISVTPRRTGQQITDLNAIFNEQNKEALVGRQVRLTGLRVQAVAAPNAYWVGPSNDRLLFVVRGAQTQGGSPDVTMGDTITIEGLVLRVPPMEQARQLWNLDQNNVGQLQNQQVYVQAHQIDVTENR